MHKNLALLEKELIELNNRLGIIDDTINKIKNNISDTKISVGSRVLINWENSPSTEGRVLGVKSDGRILVNRDGYAGTINLGVNSDKITKHNIQNLSVGTYGNLEKEQWLTNSRINQIKDILQKENN